MNLPFSVRMKLLRQDFLAAFSINGNKPVRLSPFLGKDGQAEDRCVVIHTDERDVHAASPLRWKLYRHGWEARLDRLAQEYGVGRHVHLTPESSVLDIGANAGEFAFIGARHGARVLCLEPDPIVRECLRRNVSELQNVSVHGVAAWKETGLLSFGLAPDRADSSAFVDGEEKITVAAIRLNDFIEENKIGAISLIKCDAEGAEPEVLEGLGDAAAKVSVIALDTGAERNGERTHDACDKILKDYGFDVVEEKVGTRWMTYGIRR
ncbi:MAG: FkbM family methyltransferase [Pseudomonadota bacterium]